jgi:hypothetical protein
MLDGRIVNQTHAAREAPSPEVARA